MASRSVSLSSSLLCRSDDSSSVPSNCLCSSHRRPCHRFVFAQGRSVTLFVGVGLSLAVLHASGEPPWRRYNFKANIKFPLPLQWTVSLLTIRSCDWPSFCSTSESVLVILSELVALFRFSLTKSLMLELQFISFRPFNSVSVFWTGESFQLNFGNGSATVEANISCRSGSPAW